jgi:hypothetical protein
MPAVVLDVAKLVPPVERMIAPPVPAEQLVIVTVLAEPSDAVDMALAVIVPANGAMKYPAAIAAAVLEWKL